MKKYFYMIVWAFSIMQVSANDLTQEQLKTALIPDDGWAVTSVWDWESLLDGVFAFMRDGIFGLLFILALCVFLYIAFRLIIARGNPEEFKKALNSFVYAALGLFIIAFAWAMVRLVAGLSI